MAEDRRTIWQLISVATVNPAAGVGDGSGGDVLYVSQGVNPGDQRWIDFPTLFSNIPAATGLQLVDATAGIVGTYIVADRDLGADRMIIGLEGADVLTLRPSSITIESGNRIQILNEDPTSTNPVYAFFGDADTGIGRAAANELSLIAGGAEGLRVTGADVRAKGKVYLDSAGTTDCFITSADVSGRFIRFTVDATEMLRLGPGGIGWGIPATAADTGVTGSVRISTTHIYVCTATNTWKRAALSTW